MVRPFLPEEASRRVDGVGRSPPSGRRGDGTEPHPNENRLVCRVALDVSRVGVKFLRRRAPCGRCTPHAAGQLAIIHKKHAS